jgi:cobalt/nickel transport protein
MKRRFQAWILIGLGVSLLVALFISPLASSSPDGLEKVAEAKGFKEKGEGWSLWKHAPLQDYTLPWIREKRVSTALSGFLGTASIFFIAFGLGKLLRKSPTGHDAPSPCDHEN